MRFTEYQQEAITKPWRGTWGTKFLVALGLVKDALAHAVVAAIRCAYPEYAPRDALMYHGLERRIAKGPHEEQAEYASRVRAAWETWQWAGTPYGVETTLNTVGRGLQFHVKECWTPTDAGVWAPPELNDDRWTHFWLLVDTGHGLVLPDGTWGDSGTWDDGGVWGEVIDPAQYRFLKNVVRRIKGRHARAQYLYVPMGGNFFGQSGLAFGSFNFAAGQMAVYDLWT